ncbi:MAG: hypothetical protein BroJett011_75400 [Chloroflexota bacterium]|nr:MAG: hypothetical protein BroJett011_75400 [Chloroflexota bacterium]
MEITQEISRHNGASPRLRRQVEPAQRAPEVLLPWLQAQSINVTRHAAALRPFRRDEFGSEAATPTEAHIQAVNELMTTLRTDLLRLTKRVTAAVEMATREPETARLQQVVKHKEHAHTWVRAIERIWDFYFELFGQRQSRFGDWLLSCDRIALDCYQHTYLGLGVARSIPAPPPFCYMRTGFSPATFRRGIPLRRLGQQINPFPLIQLPYHRLVNPWTLGAILHEVSHNLQNDLDLDRIIPQQIARRLLQNGHNRLVASVWARWNRETFADLSALLLGGPAVVGSLMDVVGRGPVTVLAFSSRAPHPTPYLRTFISLELLRRMGFPGEAEQYRRMWTRFYPNPQAGNIPRVMLDTYPEAIALVVDTICFQPYPSLGNKSLAQVIHFAPKEQQMVEEAARRLAAGTDPGVVPERFLIGATRFALDHRLARPGVITENFYKELARR